MREYPRFVYCKPCADSVSRGLTYDYVQVKGEDEYQAMLAKGYVGTREEVHAPAAIVEVPPDDAPVTRAELEQKARELGLRFDGRTTDRKLSAMIADKLAVPDVVDEAADHQSGV